MPRWGSKTGFKKVIESKTVARGQPAERGEVWNEKLPCISSPLKSENEGRSDFQKFMDFFFFMEIYVLLLIHFRSWLRHCATSRKVAGSIPDGVIGIFHWYNHSGRTMTLGSTQRLTEMSTRDISWGKGGRCVGLTTLPPSCADCLEIWGPQPPGTLWACPGP